MSEASSSEDELIEYSPDDVADLEGLLYEQKGDRHVIQLHAGVTYEFEIADEQVAAGLKGIGEQILSEMDSPLRDGALSPSEADRRQSALEDQE